MKMLKKQMRLYEIENIDKGKFFEKFKNRSINKKHKGIRLDTLEMNFENYAERIKVLRDVNSERVNRKMIQKRLQVKNTEMKLASESKVQLANLNDKRYYFSDEIVSLPFRHSLLSDFCKLKKSYSKNLYCY